MSAAPNESAPAAAPGPAGASADSPPVPPVPTWLEEKEAIARTALYERTLVRIDQGLKASETASITQVLELIRELSLNVDSISVHQVARIISRDLTLTTKIIKVACSVAYNPEGGDINTISQAISSVGYLRVRNIAVALLLLKNANRRFSADDFDEVACITLISALMSEAIMENRKSHNPEHTFVCAALRNYGRLVLASFFPEEYREAMKFGESKGFEPAIRWIFGMNSLEISKDILRRAKLPQSLLRFIAAVPEATFTAEELSRDDQQLMLIDFTAKFCEMLSRLNSQEQFAVAYGELVERYGRILKFTRDDVKAFLEATMVKVDSYKRQLASPLFSHRIVANIEAFLEDRPFVLQPTATPLAKRKLGPVNDTFTCGLDAERSLRVGLQELTSAVNAPAADRDAIWKEATRLLCRALELDDTLLLIQPTGSPAFQAEYGFGHQAEALRTHGLIDRSNKTIFTVCVTRAQDVIIQNPNDNAIQPFIPDWLKPHAKGGMILLPVADKEGTFAVLMGLARAKHSLYLSPKTMDHLRGLKGLLGRLRPVPEGDFPA